MVNPLDVLKKNLKKKESVKKTVKVIEKRKKRKKRNKNKPIVFNPSGIVEANKNAGQPKQIVKKESNLESQLDEGSKFIYKKGVSESDKKELEQNFLDFKEKVFYDPISAKIHSDAFGQKVSSKINKGYDNLSNKEKIGYLKKHGTFVFDDFLIDKQVSYKDIQDKGYTIGTVSHVVNNKKVLDIGLKPEFDYNKGKVYLAGSVVSPSKIKSYTGGSEFLSGLTTEQQNVLLGSYMGSSEWKNWKKNNSSMITRVGTSIQEKHLYGKKETIVPGWLNPFGGDVKAELDMVSVVVPDVDAAEKKLAHSHVFGSNISKNNLANNVLYSSLPGRQKIAYNVFESGIASASFPVTLPQIVVKHFNEGKTVVLPDVAKVLSESRVSKGQGVIGGSVSTVVSGGKSDYFKTASKDPWMTAAATVGEGIGVMVGGKAVNAAKVTSVKGLGAVRSFAASKGVSLPGYTQFARYGPVNLIRTGNYKYLEKTGKVSFVPPEKVLNPKSIPYDLSYAPGSSSASRISSTIRAFESTRVDGVMTGVHTTTNPWFKPIVGLFKGRESPGVSFAPYGKGSSRFLRIGGKVDYATNVSVLPKINLRTAPLLRFKNLVRIPKKFSGDYKSANLFIKNQGPGVYVAPKMYVAHGGEYEAIARGWAVRQGVRAYTRVEGITVPLPEFTLSGSATSFGTRVVSGIKSLPYSYNAGSNISIINPSYIVSKVFGSSVKSGSISRSFSSLDSSPMFSHSFSSNFGSSSGGSKGSSILRSSMSSSGSSIISSMSSNFGSSSGGSKGSSILRSSMGSSGSSSVYKSVSNPVVAPVFGSGIRKYEFKEKISRDPVKYRFREFKIPSLNKLLGGF